VILATIGSLGDLHPFIAVGLALQERAATGLGHAAHNALFVGQFSSYGAIGLYSTLLGDVQPD
jgi:UDP:flavonoid glycosyltransferase YjiC (YdhE family)